MRKLCCFQETGIEGKMEEEEWVVRRLSLILQTWHQFQQYRDEEKKDWTINPHKNYRSCYSHWKQCIHIKQSKNSKNSWGHIAKCIVKRGKGRVGRWEWEAKIRSRRVSLVLFVYKDCYGSTVAITTIVKTELWFVSFNRNFY